MADNTEPMLTNNRSEAKAQLLAELEKLAVHEVVRVMPDGTEIVSGNGYVPITEIRQIFEEDTND